MSVNSWWLLSLVAFFVADSAYWWHEQAKIKRRLREIDRRLIEERAR